MMPKVSILIPTYNRPKYFEEALLSALNQTYKNIEIIICDNSDNKLSKAIVEKHKKRSKAKIKYVLNSDNIGPIANQHKCFDLSTGEYINYLMDDDLFHPQKIERMIPYFLNHDGVALVTSNKQKIDASGKLIKVTNFFKEEMIMDGIKFGNKLLRRRKNRIGEPTTALFRKRDLEVPFGVFAGKQALSSVDMASWLHLLTKGKIVGLKDALSSQRCHHQQLSHLSLSSGLGSQDWNNFLKDAPKKGYSVR